MAVDSAGTRGKASTASSFLRVADGRRSEAVIVAVYVPRGMEDKRQRTIPCPIPGVGQSAPPGKGLEIQAGYDEHA